MGLTLRKNQQVELSGSTTLTVTGKLGEGGQGIVYRVQLDGTNEERALKWYFIGKLRAPRNFYNHLQELIDTGAPSNKFIWPEKLTVYEDGEPFGYIMKIFPKEYRGFSSYLNSRVTFSSAKAMVNAGLNIVRAFEALHNKGYNYQDLNDGNFSIEPQNGGVLICDNDNIMGHGQSSGILGKPRYMAPEVFRGEKSPDKQTDRYSLAVVLFLLFIGAHPLEGQRTNVAALTNKYEMRFFGTEPIFIYDQFNNSNAPVEGLHDNAITMWKFFPNFIHNAFQKSFSQDSLLKGEGRLLDRQWLNLLVRLKSSIAHCPYCGEELFLECTGETHCHNCGKNVKPVGCLDFGARTGNNVTVPIFRDVRLYEYHMDSGSEDYETETAVVLEKPDKFGLKNNSSRQWKITAPNGKVGFKAPGETAILSVGFEIDFGKGSVAKVVAND